MNAMTINSKISTEPKTNSIFDLLVDMIGDVEELISDDQPNEEAASAEGQERAELEPPAQEAVQEVIFYLSGSAQLQLTPAEVARRVIDAPEARHLVWSKGMSGWGSWTKLPQVIEAVKALLQRGAKPRLPQAATQRPSPESERAQRVAQTSTVVTSSAPAPAPISKELINLSVDLSEKESIQFYTGFYSDLSDGGLFIETDMALDAGQRVEVTIARGAGHKQLKAQGLVSWSRAKSDDSERLQPGVGVQLTMTPEVLEVLNDAFNPVRAFFYAA